MLVILKNPTPYKIIYEKYISLDLSVAMCIKMFFILSSVFSLLSPLFFFLLFSFRFSFSLRCSLSLCSALLSLPWSQVNSSVEVEVVVGCQRLSGGGCGLSTARWRWFWVGGFR
jgi:hypothetical protein